MELLNEWFNKNESNLYLLGFAIIFAMIALPAKKEKFGKDFLLMALSFSVYIICEAVLMIAAPSSYSTELLLIFIGGCAISVAIGRLVKFYLLWMWKIISSIIKHNKDKKQALLQAEAANEVIQAVNAASSDDTLKEETM